MPSEPALNFSDHEIKLAGQLLTEFLRKFEKSIPLPAVLPSLDQTVLAELLDQPFPRDGVGIERLFSDISGKIVPNSTAIAHPRFLAYVLGPPNGIAPFAAAIAATLNQNCNFWQLSPAATIIERKVISWFCELFQYPDAAGGIITSGGSMATLLALCTALQDKFEGDFRRVGLQSVQSPLVLYTSEEAHSCVEKNAVILGLGQNNVRKIPVDSDFRIRVDLLELAIAEDRTAGRHPFCVVASCGTVNTGAIDPIAGLASLCAREGLWLHVDGAFGALFVLSQQTRDEVLNCTKADSIALDPHKLLFVPLEAGCLIVRDREKLRRAFSFSAPYFPNDHDPLFLNFMDYGPQLSRSFKAFKIWCSLQVFGIEAFMKAADHMLRIARYMELRIQACSTFELLAPVNLTAVCFRIRNRDDSGNQDVLKHLVRQGTAVLGPVNIRGRLGIRACITNYRTSESDIDLILDRLLELATQ